MLISIITPSFNSGKYIERAIQSVLSQDYSNWEHIIVDGGSTDGTVEILKKYPHLKWVSEPDRGIYDAMNKGIQMAKGEWLYFMGADDYLISTMIFTEISPYLSNGIQVVYGKVLNMKKRLHFKGEFDAKRIFEENICHQGIFINRQVFKTTGYFDLRYKVLSDWDHNMKWVLDRSIRRLYLDIEIACYAADGISSTTNDYEFHRLKRSNFVKYAWKSGRSEYIRIFAFYELKRALSKLSVGLLLNASICYLKQVLYKVFSMK